MSRCVGVALGASLAARATTLDAPPFEHRRECTLQTMDLGGTGTLQPAR